ncbi:MAG: hypothetical protein H0W83_15390 [Planctomycetes bacterium]|nr:hypothetical protein [Planctomycetota bacterium]
MLFLGDSITDGWRGSGLAVWNSAFAPLKAANFGISGDGTQHVIWRLRHGELDGIQPKLVVLMIGTNNAGGPAADIALGIKAILADIREFSPKSRVLLLGIFPRSERPDALRAKVADVNKLIEPFDDGRKVFYLDIGAKFLTADQTLTKDIMPDGLHPNAAGYQIWADAILPTVKHLMLDDPTLLAPTFRAPSSSPRVAKLQASIATGKVGAGVKALEKLAEDKDGATARSASAALATVAAWKDGLDTEIGSLRAEGDVFAAAELAGGMVTSYTGSESVAKGYHDLLLEMKKDPAFAAGSEYDKLEAMPAEARKDPRFAKLVDAFVKKYPTTVYAGRAKGLVRR